MPILRVKEAFSVLSDPNGRVYTPGVLVNADDPIVKGREVYFEPVEVAASRHAPVEQATAAPGERRSVTKKAAAKKSAKSPEGDHA